MNEQPEAMTDTRALIERIKGPLPQLVTSVDRNEKADEYRLMISGAERELLAEALSRFTSPLPKEIADHIEGLLYVAQHGPDPSYAPVLRKAAAALEQIAECFDQNEQMARENEIGKREWRLASSEYEARIRELEAERDRLKDLVECKDCMEYAHRVADAIRAKTLEACRDATQNASSVGEAFDAICALSASSGLANACEQDEGA